MGWREQLRRASLRGVEFHVEAATFGGGRRTQRHEFPKRDAVHVEDLGRAARELSFEAFVLGDGYLEQRDRLIAAVEAPGPAVLVHPTFGRIDVVVERYTHTEATANRGVCVFHLSCVEHAGLVFPSSTTATVEAVTQAAEAAQTQTQATFAATFSTFGAPAYVAESAQVSLATQVARVRAELTGPAAGTIADLEAVASALDALDAEAATLITTPATLAARVSTALGQVASLAVLRRLAAVAGFAAADSAAVAGVQLEQDNDEALGRLFVREALSWAAKVSASTDYATWDDAEAVKVDLGDQLSATMAVAVDEAFDALADLRSALVDDLDTRARDLRRLRGYTPTTVRPALVVAHDLYGDAARDAEIVERNRVAHPGFVPVAELQVLSS